MVIRHPIGAAFIALSVAGAWSLPAFAAEVPVPAVEAPAPDVVKTAAPAKVTKPRLVKSRVVKPRFVRRFWWHRPIRVATVDWRLTSGCRTCGSYTFIGIGF